MSITLPPELFQNISIEDVDIGLVFTMFNTSVLFPVFYISQLFPEATNTDSFAVDSSIVGATIAGYSINDLAENASVLMGIRLGNPVSWSLACKCV